MINESRKKSTFEKSKNIETMEVMDFFKYKISEIVKKYFLNTFGSYFRTFIVSSLIFIVGGFAGALGVANGLNPRVSAIESSVSDQRRDFNDAYFQNDKRLNLLEASDTEKKIQIQMLILYQIPAAERERLRTEAENIIDNNVK